MIITGTELAHNDRSSKLERPNELVLARHSFHTDHSLSRDERIAKRLSDSFRDALKGGMKVKNKIRLATNRAVTGMVGETTRWELWRNRFPNTKTAASTLKAMVRQSLVLSDLAARRDFEIMIASVVNMYDHSFVLVSKPNWKKEPLRSWRDLSGLEKYSWAVSGMMHQSGGKQYVAFSLNLSMVDAVKAPDELIDPIRKRLGRALGCGVDNLVMFCIEKDDKDRSHCHGIYFGCLTREQNKKLKQAGGEWDGSDSRRQRRTNERYGMEDAIGWGWYMHKDIGQDAKFYIPHELTRIGQAHYERVSGVLLPYFIAARDATTSNRATSPAIKQKS